MFPSFFLTHSLLLLLLLLYPSPLLSTAFDPLLYLGTKRPYPLTHNGGVPVVPPDGYEIVQAYLISRHGTRYPSGSNIDSFDALSKYFRSQAEKIPADITWAGKWVNPFPKNHADLLSSVGEKDLYELGKRTYSRYPTLFANSTYNSNVFKLRSSEVSRSGHSASSFAAGFFEGRSTLGCTQPVYITTMPKGMDLELAMKYACPRWLNEVRKSKLRIAEETSFIKNHVRPIAQRLSAEIFNEIPISDDQVLTMYRACGFLVAHYGLQNDTWCSIFKENELLRLEYLGDMAAFITYSYGSELNSHMGCPLASNLALQIKAVAEGDETAVKGEFMFGHAETILFFATFMGLYRDPYPLTSDLSDADIRGRSFRTSRISPFAANYQLEIYRCTSSNCSGSRYLVRMLVNEKPTKIPALKPADGVSEYYYPSESVVEYLTRNGICRFQKECEERPEAEEDGESWFPSFRIQWS